MSIEPKMYTLKVNIRAQEERERKEKERQLTKAISGIHAISGPPAKPRKRKGLNFHEPGTFIAQGQQLRKKARLEELKRKIAQNAAKTGIADAAKLLTLTTGTSVTADLKPASSKLESKSETILQPLKEDVPDVEWWDRPILGRQSLDDVILRLVQQTAKPEEVFYGITNLIEHPPAEKPTGIDTSNVQMPIFLTQKERKKLRRQNRKNQELEKQEKIKLGFLPKPEPKLKRSNIMYALGDEALTNPSLADKMVRDQEEKRLQAHIEHNESKKLTLKEKREKKLRKIREDLSVTGVWVSVYRITNLIKQSYRLKTISQNVKQLTMSGVIVIHKDINLVIVEGGPKQQRKFKHLMLERIKWTEEDPLMTDLTDEFVSQASNLSNQSSRCDLLWEGQAPKKMFTHIKTKQFTEEQDVRKFFKEHDTEHLWDLAFKTSIFESIDAKR